MHNTIDDLMLAYSSVVSLQQQLRAAQELMETVRTASQANTSEKHPEITALHDRIWQIHVWSMEERHRECESTKTRIIEALQAQGVRIG